MHITGCYVALATVLVLSLAARVIWMRNRRKVALGDGGIPELARAVRAHANAVEYLPLGLLLLLLLDLDQARPGLLHLCGATLIAGRMLHAWGLSRHAGRSFGRTVGIVLTWLVMLAMAMLLLWQFLWAGSVTG